MRKPKYFFNPQNLHFEQVKVGFWTKFLRIFGFISAAMVFAGLLLVAAYTYIDSPKEKLLKNENLQYELQLRIMDDKVNRMEAMLSEIEQRDDKIYRAIFEADPIHSDLRKAGIGGIDRYKELQGFRNSELLARTAAKIDQLSSKMYVQSKSFDELAKLAAQKTEMLACIPAIQPVSNKDLTRMASGFGMRIHPIYKTHKMHTGMDFTAPTGTDINATGNGKVIKAEYDRGYGQTVIIDHGFGYQTLYAHMSKILVKPGQQIKRGEVIGKIGSTGTSTAPHLHYEVIKNGKKINPINFYFNDLTPEEYERIREMAGQAGQSFD